MPTKQHYLTLICLATLTFTITCIHAQKAAPPLPDACCPDENKTGTDLLLQMCEHKIPIIACEECRYEIGVVKVAPALLAPGTNTPALIQLGTVTNRALEQGLDTVGEVALNENATVRLSSPISGIIRHVKGDTGTAVKSGESLVEIESSELVQTISAHVKNRIQTEAALRSYQREKALADQKISAQMEADEALARFESSKADLEETTHALKAMGFSDLELVNLAGSASCTLPIRSPCAGTLIEKAAVAGNRIQAGQTIMTVSDLTSVWVWLDLYERDLAAIVEVSAKQPLAVILETGAFPGRRFKGVLENLGTTMDETTRTVKARALIPNPDGLLRPGMFCKARLSWTQRETVLAVPRQAVLEDEGNWFVFTWLQQEYYIRRPVTKGREFNEWIEITGGLKEGEGVVTEGAFLLKSDVLREKMGAGCAD